MFADYLYAPESPPSTPTRYPTTYNPGRKPFNPHNMSYHHTPVEVDPAMLQESGGSDYESVGYVCLDGPAGS